MTDALHNYLRMHRKRAGLTQGEVAFLLGTKSGSKVSRYETAAREVPLDTAMALAVIFGRPITELFAGEAEEVEKEVHHRAKRLLASVRGIEPDDHIRTLKTMFLEGVLDRTDE